MEHGKEKDFKINGCKVYYTYKKQLLKSLIRRQI